MRNRTLRGLDLVTRSLGRRRQTTGRGTHNHNSITNSAGAVCSSHRSGNAIALAGLVESAKTTHDGQLGRHVQDDDDAQRQHAR